MSNPLEPGNHRNNWLEEERPDTSWFFNATQAMLGSTKRQIEILLRKLKEAPVMLLNPDESRDFHGSIEYPEDFIPESDDPDWEGHYYPEDPVEFGHFDAENETFSEYLKRLGQ